MRRTSNPRRLLGTSLLALATLAGASHAAAAPSVRGGSLLRTPTWSDLYRRYMAKGTVGDCASCHAEATTPDGAYDWLAEQQYMAGVLPYLVDPRASCFSWLGGDMPPEGPSSYPRARRDFLTWAIAGGGEE